MRKSTKKTAKKSTKKSSGKKVSCVTVKKLKKCTDCRYKSDQPSPKGLGFCAHNQKEGVKARGTDGNMWMVKQRSNGSLYWAKSK